MNSIMISAPQTIDGWLNKIFESRQNGLLLDSDDLNSFEEIQDFIEAQDHSTKTRVIYYQAFADEDADELLDTLEEELRLKLGYSQSKDSLDISELVALAELKTVVIDRSHLCDREMLERLWQRLAENQINLILVASQAEMHESEILNHPVISQWEKFVADAEMPDTFTSEYRNFLN